MRGIYNSLDAERKNKGKENGIKNENSDIY